jgi:upstream activation factor subunit UAF30
MPRQTKPSSSTIATPVAAPAVSDASTKKAAVKKTKTEVVATPAPTPVVVAPVATTPEPESKPAVTEDAKSISSEALLTAFDAKIQQVASIAASLKNDSKALRKQIAQDKKAAEKLAKKSFKKKRVAVEGEEVKPRNSGFMRPVRISDELASFLGKPAGAVMGRQVANDEIRKYVTANNLKETEKGKGRNINPDAKLFALLKLPANEQLTYFNLQKYMKPHFIKIEEATATA